MDVQGGTIAQGTNVIQYNQKGGNNQRWKVTEVSTGVYKIASYANTNYVLGLPGNTTENEGNIAIYQENNTASKRFHIILNSDGYSYRIMTGASSYGKAVTVQSASFSNSANVFQYTYNGTYNDEWIFEPVHKFSPSLFENYAVKNYNSYVPTYPNMTAGDNYDCTNFASQCMLAGGIHFQGKWWIYKNNNKYPKPANGTQFDDSWSVDTMGGILGFGASSPWVSAKQFNNFWSGIVSRTDTFTVSYAKSHKPNLYALSYYVGDIIMILDSKSNGYHTMCITGYYKEKLEKVVFPFLESDPNLGHDIEVAYDPMFFGD